MHMRDPSYRTSVRGISVLHTDELDQLNRSIFPTTEQLAISTILRRSDRWHSAFTCELLDPGWFEPVTIAKSVPFGNVWLGKERKSDVAMKRSRNTEGRGRTFGDVL